MGNKIIPHLWFDREAVEAAEFYKSVFENTKIISKSVIPDTPSGDCDLVEFEINGFRFMGISAGPMFKKNPSISFFVNFEASPDAEQKLNTAWDKLVETGKELMPLQEYPWSKRYGWVQDKYGVSWQLILTNPEGEERPTVIPSVLFTREMDGKAEEAVNFWLSVFKDSKLGSLMYFGADGPAKEGNVMFSDFKLGDTWLVAMDGGEGHEFQFNEGISLIVNCKDQAEIDYFTEKLSAFPEAEQCGWIKDKYGVSWQILPENMDELIAKNPKETIPAMLNMKKISIAELKTAGEVSS